MATNGFLKSLVPLCLIVDDPLWLAKDGKNWRQNITKRYWYYGSVGKSTTKEL
jgi:hypothetical protein